MDQLITSAFDPSLNQFLNHTTNYDYDAANRLTDSFDPLNHHTSFTYYPTGQMATSKSWLNRTTGYTTTYDYNPAGEQISVTDANDHTTQYRYNERGLLKKTIYPLGPSETGEIATSQTYDFAGRLATSTDENGIVTRNAYNAAGQLTGVTLADGTADATLIQYGYNLAGQLTSITHALTHVTRFEYNDAGQQIKKILPDNITYEQFHYNAAGNMDSHRLEDGNTNTFTYDKLNRLTRIAYFDGQFADFTYTDGGQRDTASTRTQAPAVPQVTDYDYDPFQRLKSVTGPDDRTVSYTYYDNDLRKTMATSAGTITYGYDGLDRLTSVLAGAAETTYQYDPVGFMTDAYLPNGIHTQYIPNVRNQLTNIISKNSSGTTLLSFAYDEIDKAGNRKKVTEADGSYIKWEYDNLYRLKSEKRYNSSNAITWESSFTYDAAGNRDSMTVNSTTTTYQYNALDQLTSAGAITYDYDGRGNLNKITNGSQITNYTYNAADQLASVTLPNSTNMTYGYDADGRRVKQTVGSTITNYLWDEASTYGDVVFEYNGSGSTLASYVLGGTGLISQTRGSTTSYFLQDGQGSTRALTSSSSPATVTDTYFYTAFGELFNSSGTTVNPYRYTGQQFDSLTGLYDLRARYYNPALGRFLSQDIYPVNFNNPVELNRYVYTGNNPINLVDPMGHDALGERSVLNFFSRQNATTLIKVGIGVTAVLLAVNALLPYVQPRIWDPEAGPLPRIESREDIEKLPAIWVRTDPNPRPEPEPTRIGTKVPPIVTTPTKGPTRRLYHATTIDKVLSILSGINLTIGKESPDFGQGFYTTASFTDAVGIATRWKGGTGAIVVFDVPIAELNSLNHLVFTSADSSWDNFVLFNRSVTGLHHNYDWVEGPVAKSWDLATRTVVPFEYPAYHQLSIHTSAAAQLFQRSITEILDYGDPNVNP